MNDSKTSDQLVCICKQYSPDAAGQHRPWVVLNKLHSVLLRLQLALVVQTPLDGALFGHAKNKSMDFQFVLKETLSFTSAADRFRTNSNAIQT